METETTGKDLAVFISVLMVTLEIRKTASWRTAEGLLADKILAQEGII